jgi:hypothetical protein
MAIGSIESGIEGDIMVSVGRNSEPVVASSVPFSGTDLAGLAINGSFPAD